MLLQISVANCCMKACMCARFMRWHTDILVALLCRSWDRRPPVSPAQPHSVGWRPRGLGER